MPKSFLSTNHVKFEEEEIHNLHSLKGKFNGYGDGDRYGDHDGSGLCYSSEYGNNSGDGGGSGYGYLGDGYSEGYGCHGDGKGDGNGYHEECFT
jgi:hypothetical protein